MILLTLPASLCLSPDYSPSWVMICSPFDPIFLIHPLCPILYPVIFYLLIFTCQFFILLEDTINQSFITIL